MIDSISFWQKFITQLTTYHPRSKTYNLIELARDCITLYSEDENALRVPTISGGKISGKTVAIKAGNAPCLYDFYKDHNLPTTDQLKTTFKDGNTTLPLVTCNNRPTFTIYNPSKFPEETRHAFWHTDTSQKPTHHHFATLSHEDLTPDNMNCFFDRIKYFNKFSRENILSEKEITEIISLYEKEKHNLNQQIKSFAQASVESFFRIAITSFCLEFFGRYLVPFFMYHTDKISHADKNVISSLAKIIFPAFTWINTLLNNKILSLPTIADTITLLLNALNINILSPEISSAVKIVFALSQGNFTKTIASEVGSNFGFIFGGASAKALGQVIASLCVKSMPKLKIEPAVEAVASIDTKTSHSEKLHHRITFKKGT